MAEGKRKKGAQTKRAKKKKDGSDGRLNRTEVIGVRLDPKLKFAAELGARKQRRPLSNYIVWAVEEATKNTKMIAPNCSLSAHDVMESTWSSDDCCRLTNLGINYPQFLTFEEEKTWCFILEYSKAWVKGDADLTLYQSQESLQEEFMKIPAEDFDRLDKLWPYFLAAGKGDKEAENYVAGLHYKSI